MEVRNVELNELYKNTLVSSAHFIAKDIQNEKNRKRFLSTINIIANNTYYENMHDLDFFLREKIFFLETDDSISWWLFSKKHTFELAAYNVALDVCESFLKRFVDGGSGEGNALI